MFEIPSAKRVKRSQLFNSGDEADTTGPRRRSIKDETLDAHDDVHQDNDAVVPDYGFEYEFISPDKTFVSGSVLQQATVAEPAKSAEKDSETYQFNLFAPSRPSKSIDTQSQLPTSSDHDEIQHQPQPLQISIRSPSPVLEPSGPGPLTTSRPLAQYLTSALSPKTQSHLRTTYLASAVDSQTLTKLSTLLWPGTHQPWRTISLPAHRKQVVIVRTTSTKSKSTPSTTISATVPAEKSRHRARPSKKRRDLARSRAQKRQILIDETKTKEEHEREKKNKKNRERKLKRRAKERREKGVKGGGSEGGGVEGSVSVSVDGSAE